MGHRGRRIGWKGIGFVKKKSRGPKIESKGGRGRATILRAGRIWHAEHRRIRGCARFTPRNYSERWFLLYLGRIWDHRVEEFARKEISSRARPLSIRTAGKLNSFFFFVTWPFVADRIVWKRVLVSNGRDLVKGNFEKIRNLSIFLREKKSPRFVILTTYLVS